MKISDLIGETTEYDKKQAVEERKPKSWRKSVSAFANGKGGSLIFGVADDDTIIGLAGLGKIIDAYENAHNFAPGMEPTFFSNRAQFTVTLRNLNIGTAGYNQGYNPGYNDTIHENEILNAFLNAIKEDPKISQRRFSEKTGYSKKRVQTAVETLTSEGMIERIGGTRGYWKIKE